MSDVPENLERFNEPLGGIPLDRRAVMNIALDADVASDVMTIAARGGASRVALAHHPRSGNTSRCRCDASVVDERGQALSGDFWLIGSD